MGTLFDRLSNDDFRRCILMTGNIGTPGKRPGRPGVRPTMTTERVRKLLDYDPETGIFRRRSDGRRWKRGDFAGGICKSTGYLQISLDGSTHLMHRLAFLWLGETIPDCVDHIDRCRTNNRRANLRAATASQNKANASIRVDNKTGAIGVSWESRTKRYKAVVQMQGRVKHVGYFDTVAEAAAARDAAALAAYGEFAVLNNDLSSTAP